MKTYRLKQRYPSLPKWVEIGAVARYIKMYECYFISNYTIQVSEVENNPDFWELIEEKEPLFTTEDGEAPLGQMVVCVRKSDCAKKYIYTDEKTAFNLYWVYFIDEYNADEYIWRNKRVFSYKDIENYGVHPVNMIRVEKLAKERSKECTVTNVMNQ